MPYPIVPKISYIIKNYLYDVLARFTMRNWWRKIHADGDGGAAGSDRKQGFVLRAVQ